MIKLFSILIILFCIGCDSKSPENVIQNNLVNLYPKVIDSLGYQDIFDTAKFYLYAYDCDKKITFLNDTTKEAMYLSYLPLEYDTIKIKGDTAELYFMYKYKGLKLDPNFLKEFVFYKSGVAFNLETKKPLYLTTDRNLILKETGKLSRFENPLQNEVVNFVKRNAENVNKWFKSEVQKRINK
jgi:hypothetical protein